MTDAPLVNVENLTVRFEVKRGIGFGKKSYLYAVDDVSFAVKRGETLAIVGESGSGKTTAALAVARLVSAHQGQVVLDGEDILSKEGEALRQTRQKVQFIFQDPYSSLNPRKRAEAIVREPLDSLSDKPDAEKTEIVDGLFEAVGLRPEQKRLFPHQFSGGQRQRIGIARALATQPEIIICDEPVSALDVAVQAQILNLLRRLQSEYGLTYLFISHDLGVVQHMCDTVGGHVYGQGCGTCRPDQPVQQSTPPLYSGAALCCANGGPRRAGGTETHPDPRRPAGSDQPCHRDAGSPTAARWRLHAAIPRNRILRQTRPGTGPPVIWWTARTGRGLICSKPLAARPELTDVTSAHHPRSASNTRRNP